MIWLYGVVGFALWFAAYKALKLSHLSLLRMIAGLTLLALSNKLTCPAYGVVATWVKALF